MVATYEKALGLILTDQLSPANALIVADELQILGEPGRGPEIESLCAVLRQPFRYAGVLRKHTVLVPNSQPKPGKAC